MSKNTTTCYDCGNDFPDNEMVNRPGDNGGELCPKCAATAYWKPTDDCPGTNGSLCGFPLCTTRVKGIYCPPHRSERAALMAEDASRGWAEGQRVSVEYRGAQREGIIRDLGRVNARVLLDNGSRTVVSRPFAQLTKVTS